MQSLYLALTVAFILSISAGFGRYFHESRLFLDITISTDSPVKTPIAQLFYNVSGSYSEKYSESLLLQPEIPRQLLRFSLPRKNIYSMRFDILNGSGTVTLYDIRITTNNGNLFYQFPLDAVQPLAQIESLQMLDRAVKITTLPDANDPSVSLVHQKDSFEAKGETFLYPVLKFTALLFFMLFTTFFLLLLITRTLIKIPDT